MRILLTIPVSNGCEWGEMKNPFAIATIAILIEKLCQPKIKLLKTPTLIT